MTVLQNSLFPSRFLRTPDAAKTLGLRPATTGSSTSDTYIEPTGREVLTTAQTSLRHLRSLEAGTQPNWQVGDRLHLSFAQEDAILLDADDARIPEAKND